MSENWDVTRNEHYSTYEWRLEDLDHLRDRVSDLYAIGATGKECVKYQNMLTVRIASDDLWPKKPPKPPSQRSLVASRLAVTAIIEAVVIFVLFVVIAF